MWRTVTGIAWWHSSVTGRQEWSGIAGAGWPPLRVRSLGVVTECALAEERRRPARSARTCVRSPSPRRCAPAVVPDVGHHVGIGQPEVKGSQVQVLSARQRNRRWGAGRPTWATRLSCASATPLGGGAAAVPRREEVADDIAITVGAASKVIDRWERAELVRRVSNPSDRRSSLLQLTLPGSAALSEGGRVAATPHPRTGERPVADDRHPIDPAGPLSHRRSTALMDLEPVVAGDSSLGEEHVRLIAHRHPRGWWRVRRLWRAVRRDAGRSAACRSARRRTSPSGPVPRRSPAARCRRPVPARSGSHGRGRTCPRRSA
jgi:hypothetical protein